MLTIEAMSRKLASDGRMMVFDWDRAAALIRERKPKTASAGLCEDWEWTGGQIYADNKPDCDSYTYLASCHAKPELDMDGDVVECWRWEGETDWTHGTKWPESALRILNTGK